jgi:radical SAM-linked protein
VNRFRVHYSKTEPLRYTGMLDVQHIWERLFRRAHLDLAYSQGFHPQPRIQQAAPLPLGFLSSFEILDFWLEGSNDSLGVIEMITKAIQPGLEIYQLKEVDPSLPPLQTGLETATYQSIDLAGVTIGYFRERMEQFLEQKEVLRERRGKKYDLRPLVLSISVVDNSDGILEFVTKLSAKEGATGRPDEVAAALGYDPFDLRYQRISLGFSSPIFP